MKLHEYQAKSLLARYGVAMLPGIHATTVEEAVKAATELGDGPYIVKAQIHAGGRGKGRFIEQVSAEAIARAAEGEDAGEGKGGVRFTTSLDAVRDAASDMLGNTLVTKQTGAEGRKVRTVYVCDAADIKEEFYLSLLLDRSTNRVIFMGSREGGVDIEDVAEHRPEAIFKVEVDSAVGMTDFQGRYIAKRLGLEGKPARKAVGFFRALFNAYVGTDAAMLEINPVVLTDQGDIFALDCKMEVDGNALYRHKDVVEMRDLHEEEPAEIEASEFGLSFIKLDGNIGCLVNGAGLAMSTMDIIQFKGGSPANFLDVGGGANQAQVKAAFEIITRDPSVKGILVNIFGGIMKCDVIAEGVIGAVKEVGLEVPLVVRLSGTNSELGKKILKESGLAIIPADNLDEAATAIVSAVKEA